mgnify:CR=1 FL=1
MVVTIGGKKLFVSTVEADKSKSSTKLYWGEKRATASLIATLDKTAQDNLLMQTTMKQKYS